MRLLVLGATGYVGSRLVPELLAAGHDVVAASSASPDPGRFAWGHQVVWRQCDVTDRAAVGRAVRGCDGICYLVHSLAHRGFADLDRRGATNVRAAASRARVRRLVYLSGLVPDHGPAGALSAHLASRLEVEEELARADCDTLSVRAGLVVGAGSTSYEVMRQLAALLLVQPVPGWLRSEVQPVAVSDVVRALVVAFEDGAPTGAVDVGGPDVLGYPDLLARFTRAAGFPRLRVSVPAAPVAAVALSTALLVGAPFWTVTALVESLRHDLVCRPGQQWSPGDAPWLGVEESIERALGRRGPDVAEAPLPSDPAWTRMQAPVLGGLLDQVGAPAFVRAGASLAVRRAGDLWRLSRGTP